MGLYSATPFKMGLHHFQYITGFKQSRCMCRSQSHVVTVQPAFVTVGKGKEKTMLYNKLYFYTPHHFVGDTTCSPK